MSNNEYIANRPVDIVLDKEAMRKAAMSVHGLTYKGFGVLSGNATSSLLMDYKADCPDVYWKLVETLFGGSRPMMNTIKVEMAMTATTPLAPTRPPCGRAMSIRSWPVNPDSSLPPMRAYIIRTFI